MDKSVRPKSLDRLFGERTAQDQFRDEIREQVRWVLANEDEILRRHGKR